MKKWAYFSIFVVKVTILASSIALLGIILFLSDSNNKKSRGSCCNAQQPPRNMLKFNRIYFPVVE